MITQKDLKAQLFYDPLTGVFIRQKATTGNVNIGDIAGTLHTKGYIVIQVLGIRCKAHRLAWLYMTGKWPKHQVDHENHIRHDNRWSNLRAATNAENQKNASMRIDNTSGVVGVYYYKRDNKWEVKINANSKTIRLGRYKDKQEAIKVRKQAEILYGFHPNHGGVL